MRPIFLGGISSAPLQPPLGHSLATPLIGLLMLPNSAGTQVVSKICPRRGAPAKVTNLIALGDSEFEMTAARKMREQFDHALLKTVKFQAARLFAVCVCVRAPCEAAVGSTLACAAVSAQSNSDARPPEPS